MYVAYEDPQKLGEELKRAKKEYADLIKGGMEVEELVDLWGTIFELERRLEATMKICDYPEDVLLKGTA